MGDLNFRLGVHDFLVSDLEGWLRVAEDFRSFIHANFLCLQIFGLTQASILHALVVFYFRQFLQVPRVVMVLRIDKFIRSRLIQQNLVTLKLPFRYSHLVLSRTVPSYRHFADFDGHV